jgi:UDP-N-acetylmuramoylalanine--D-glutamate ligase
MDTKKLINQVNQLRESRVESLKSFGETAHRLQTVALVNGVEWINDSKATDVETTYLSLELMQKPLVWIVGSAEEYQDYSVLDKMIKYKIKSIICFGKSETTLKYRYATWVDSYAHKSTLEEAVACAAEWVQKGDAVLFSPATPGFDLFGGFRLRGEVFEKLVKEL